MSTYLVEFLENELVARLTRFIYKTSIELTYEGHKTDFIVSQLYGYHISTQFSNEKLASC